MVRLPAEFSKNKKPRVLPLVDALKDIIQRRIKARDLIFPVYLSPQGKADQIISPGIQYGRQNSGAGRPGSS